MNNVSIFKVTNSSDWLEVMNLADQIVSDIIKKALTGNRQEADDALSVARGAATFLDRFKREIGAIRSQFGVQDAAEKEVDEFQPLEIL